ncbi:MAG: TMEM165/GDT1 family protein [Desulfurococcaceae archaeon]|jgi:putative Ca2+/H+ antiporter (TMEM165/GDT1 family)
MDLLAPIASTAALIFLAELGDKTMIATMALAMQTRRYFETLLTSLAAFVLANTISIGAGCLVRHAVDLSLVHLVASALFVAFGAWILLGREGAAQTRVGSGLLACFLAVFISEMGDKTQLAVFSSVLLYGSPVLVMLGGALGYGLASVIGVLAAKIIETRLGWSKVRLGAGVAMIVVGLIFFVLCLHGLCE